jgi:hypothetical protein
VNQQMRPGFSKRQGRGAPHFLGRARYERILFWSVVTLSPFLLLRMALGEEPSKQVAGSGPHSRYVPRHSFVVLVRHSFRRPRSGSSP